MNETDTPTPETDALRKSLRDNYDYSFSMDQALDYCEKLERERDEARQEADKFRQIAVERAVMAGDLASDNRWIKTHLDQARKLAEKWRNRACGDEGAPYLHVNLPWEKPDAQTA